MANSDCLYRHDLAGPLTDLAESIVMQAYVRLPLLPRQSDGCRLMPLVRIGGREVRLVESVPTVSGQAVLRVDLFDRGTQSIVESRDCEEVEEAGMAFSDMIALALA